MNALQNVQNLQNQNVQIANWNDCFDKLCSLAEKAENGGHKRITTFPIPSISRRTIRVFKFYNSTTYVQRRFASRIKRRRWVDKTARKLVEVTEREARRRHRHGNINVKITFAVGANIDHPCSRGHKGGGLPNRKLIQALARLRRVVLIDEYYTTKLLDLTVIDSAIVMRS